LEGIASVTVCLLESSALSGVSDTSGVTNEVETHVLVWIGRFDCVALSAKILDFIRN
jgi:hypothetical protein